MTARADDTVAKLGSLTENLMVDVRTIIGEVRSTVDAMRSVTSDVVSRMNSGAETMFWPQTSSARRDRGSPG